MSKSYETVARFPGIVKKVQTISTGDGAYRITVDVPENAVEAMMELMKLQSKPQVCAIIVAKEIKELSEPESEDDGHPL